jgi:hypothetical protein
VIIELTLGTSVDELTSVETLNSDEILSTVLVLVGVSEDNLGERCATTSVVHNFLDDSLDVPKEQYKIKDAGSYPSLSAKSRVLN